jgi:hypothetical protein
MGFIIRTALMVAASIGVYKFFKSASQKANDDLEAVRRGDDEKIIHGTLKQDEKTGEYKL